MVSVVWFGLVSSSLSPMALIILQRPVWRPTPVQWAVLSGAGLAAFVGQCLLNAGLQLAPAGPGTVMRNLDVVFAFLYQVFLLHDAAKPTSVAGASLVTLSAALIVAAKWRSTSRQRRGA